MWNPFKRKQENTQQRNMFFENELELTDKLLKTFHLNVLERKKLPGGKARLSVILIIIKQILSHEHYFPVTWSPDSPYLVEGALLEKVSNNKIKLLYLHNSQLLNTIKFNDFDKAIIKFLKINFG